MKLYGLIGRKLVHSFSAKYFEEKFRKEKIEGCAYKLFPLDYLSQLNELIKTQPQLVGLNVTIPFKQQIMSYLDDLDQTAKAVQAVNTVCIVRNEAGYSLKGFNTDINGFKNSYRFPAHIRKAMILGTGGAARAIAYALSAMNIEPLFVSRYPEGQHSIGYTELKEEHFREYLLIVNTTPCGMFPDIESFPQIPYPFVHDGNILYDLVYNPETTRFLHFGKEKGATVLNGLKMLELQAEESWKVWNSTV